MWDLPGDPVALIICLLALIAVVSGVHRTIAHFRNRYERAEQARLAAETRETLLDQRVSEQHARYVAARSHLENAMAEAERNSQS